MSSRKPKKLRPTRSSRHATRSTTEIPVFRLEIDQIPQAGFSEVAVGDLSTDPIEYREGDEITTVRKPKGLNKYGNITLKWVSRA